MDRTPIVVTGDHRLERTDRRNGAIILLDEERNDVMQWEFENAWPNKIEAPSFNATGNEVAIETVELIHEGLKLTI